MSEEFFDRLFKIRMAVMCCAILMVMIANIFTAKTGAGLFFFTIGNVVAGVSVGIKYAENLIRKALYP